MALPAWLPKNPLMDELANEYAGLDKRFDTSGIQSGVENANSFMLNDSRARATSMAAAAQNRARRNGGQVAASFAAGSAMMPAYRQQADALSNLAQLKMQAAQGRATAGASIASDLAGRRQQQQGLMSDWQNATLNRNQQESQFGRQLGQQNSQFGRTLDFNKSQMAQQGSQFDRSLSQGANQFDRTMDFNQGTQNTQARMQALQMAMRLPQQNYSWTADNNGNVQTGVSAYNASQAQNLRNRSIQTQLMQMVGLGNGF